MGISSSDIAGINAQDAQRSASDLFAIVEWMQGRIAELERIAGVEPAPKPELPSERASRLHREYIAEQQAKGWPVQGFGSLRHARASQVQS